MSNENLNNFTLNQLRQIAKNQGIKYSSKMSKARICEALGIDQIPLDEKYVTFSKEALKNPRPVKLIHLNSSWIESFPSISKASQFFNINPGSIKQAYDRNTKLYIQDEPYKIEFYDFDKNRPEPKDSKPKPRKLNQFNSFIL